MAIKKEIKTKLGVSATYWTIFYQCVLNNRLQINLAGYIDEQAYLDGKQSLARKEVSVTLDKTKTVNWGDLYSIVKETEEFLGAEDLL